MKNKSIVCIVLVVGLVLAWFMGLSNASSESNGYNNHINAAKQFEKEMLYAKAINEYRNALTFKDTLDLRIKIVEMNVKALENGELSSDGNLVALLDESMNKYKKDAKIYEVACQYYYSVTDYDELSNALLIADANKVTSKNLQEIKDNIKYLYEKKYSTFPDHINLTNGYYIMKELDSQYAVDELFSSVLSKCNFISPFSADGYTVAKKDTNHAGTKVFILDETSERVGYLPDEVEYSSGLSNDNIACKIGDKYSYYTVKGAKASKDYVYAGRFNYGVAAVQNESGKWMLINKNYEALTNTVYEDIKLNSAEECVAGGIILAKTGGKYIIIEVDYNDEKPEDVSIKANTTFKCDDCELPIDAQTGSNNGAEWFAFKSGDKWGYADASGSIKVKPQFALAKSFSNGFAAVSSGELWNFINEEGNVVLKTELINAGYFNSEGVCLVKYDNGYWTYIRMYFWQV